MRRTVIGLSTVALVVTMNVAALSPAEAANKEYKNCTALNKDYPHGVGRPNAKDKTSGKPVTNFKKSKSIYKKNKKSDRDGDGIACEKL